MPGLQVVEIATQAGEALDCETWYDITGNQDVGGAVTLQDWMDALADALEIDTEVDMTAVLDLARDAAHNVARPAAPLTTFIVGYAAGQRGGTEEQLAECVDIATALAAGWDKSA